MYDLHPSRVYVHRRVHRNPKAVARMERILRALGNPRIEEVDENDTERVIRESGPSPGIPLTTWGVAQGVEKRASDPAMLFNTFEWDESRRKRPTKEYPNPLCTELAMVMGGVGDNYAFSQRDPWRGTQAGELVCQGGWGIHTLSGCVHKCDYCAEGYIVNMMLDLEDFADHLTHLFERRPQQKLYRYDVMSDTICFEPEYGASAILSDCFARSGDKYLLYYTKSDNVDHLLDLPKSNCIFYCTLSTETVCRVIERDTPSLDRRIRGLRRCHDAGYPIRVGFSPIIPVRNWREEATQALERLFASVKPEVIRLWVVSLMKAREFERAIDVDLVDPGYVDAMRKAAPELDDALMQLRPFPRWVRQEIYAHYIDEIHRISPDTPVGLCSEDRALWDALADRLNMTPDSLFCCCGGTSPAMTKQTAV